MSQLRWQRGLPVAAVVPASPPGDPAAGALAIEVGITALDVATGSTGVVASVLESVVEALGAVFSAIDL